MKNIYLNFYHKTVWYNLKAKDGELYDVRSVIMFGFFDLFHSISLNSGMPEIKLISECLH